MNEWNQKKKRSMKMKMKIPPLPKEVVVRILLRLPVKSLLRFKCVCKLWLSLISDPHFAISHFELASAPTRRIMFRNRFFPQARCIDLDASLHDDSASALIKLPKPLHGVEILGSCRGFLLLLGSASAMYLWNPSTGFHKQLPLSPFAASDLPTCFAYLYGFGYEPSTDDYLACLAYYDTNGADYMSQFEFFSLRANSWGKMEGAHLPYMNGCDDHRVGTLLHGAIHWLAYRHDVTLDLILAFDLAKRSFSEIHLPNDLMCESRDCDLLVHEGLLSLCARGGEYGCEIWVMEEYKVQSSWTKSIDIHCDDIPTEYFSEICTTGSGDIVGYDGSEGLVKCNAEGEVLDHRSYPCEREATMYTESLLTLPGDNGQAQDE